MTASRRDFLIGSAMLPIAGSGTRLTPAFGISAQPERTDHRVNEIKDRVKVLVERYRNDVAPIVSLGDPVLRRGAEPYDGQLDDVLLRDFIGLMRRTMEKAPGVGLAAPQVGVALQIAVLEDTAEVPEDVASARRRYPLEFLTIINPEYVPDGGERRGFYEGCLSMPGYTAVVNRPLTVEAKYIDLTGSRQIVALAGLASKNIPTRNGSPEGHRIRRQDGNAITEHPAELSEPMGCPSAYKCGELLGVRSQLNLQFDVDTLPHVPGSSTFLQLMRDESDEASERS